MPGWGYQWGWGGGTGWPGAVITIVTMIVFWGGFVVVAVLVQRHIDRPRSDGDSARRILDDRFARGEIDDEEHRARRASHAH